MEIHEMKDDGRYGISIKANGSVWKKIAAAAEKNGVSVNKFMIDCARTGWKNADVDKLSEDTFEDLKAEYPMLEGYISAYSNMISVTGIVKFTNVTPQTALQIINKLVNEGRLIKGRSCGIWKFVDVDNATLKAFAMSWLEVDDEIRRYAVQFIQEAGSYRPAEAMSTWTKRIRNDLSASESYELFLTEHQLGDDFGFESYVKSEISKISKAFDIEGVSHKKKSGGIDINPDILQEMNRRDIDFDGWDDLV
jgi:hypothetical protein